MAKKPGSKAEFKFYDVIYEDGSQRSNRRVPSEVTAGQDADTQIRTIIEQQDREIAEKSGMQAMRIKTIRVAAR